MATKTTTKKSGKTGARKSSKGAKSAKAAPAKSSKPAKAAPTGDVAGRQSGAFTMDAFGWRVRENTKARSKCSYINEAIIDAGATGITAADLVAYLEALIKKGALPPSRNVESRVRAHLSALQGAAGHGAKPQMIKRVGHNYIALDALKSKASKSKARKRA